MLNKKAIQAIQKQIKNLEAIRDQLLKASPGGNFDPICNKIDELYKELLKELGYEEKDESTTQL